MHGEGQDVGFRGGFANLANRLEPVHFRYGEVEEYHVGLVFLHIVESFDAVGGLRANESE
jgi:hypothetical protein